MTDKERREEYALENLIQTAYEFSDDQLLKELEETEATLSDSDFPGIEDRIYQKLKARLAEEAAKETAVEAPEEQKVVRFGKKKAVVVGILAAAFVGMLGVTAIGEKNYFFRDVELDVGVAINNDRNLAYVDDLDEAYNRIENNLELVSLKLGYIPENMKLISLDINEKNANMMFDYDGCVINLFQEELVQGASVGVNSDRQTSSEVIFNEWISKEFCIEEEFLEGGKVGYAATLRLENARYRLVGKIDKKIMIKIIENLTF